MYERFNWSLWRKLGGTIGNEPYCDHIVTPSGNEMFRAFIDADIFHDWDDFREQSLLAVKAHLLQLDPRHDGQYIRRPFAEPMSDRPSYLIEVCDGFTILWINAVLKNEFEFEAAKATGKLKRDEIKQAQKRFGSPLWKYQVDFPTTKYVSASNEPEDNEVMQLLKRNGIR